VLAISDRGGGPPATEAVTVPALAWGFLAVAGTLTLTACSDGGDGARDGGAKEITFMFRGGPDEKAAYEAAIKKYTEDTGVKVKVIDLGRR